MKILYFHQHFSTPRGGGGIRSYVMAKKLVARGHEVILVCGSYENGDTGIKGEFKHGRRQGIVEGIRVIEFDLAYSNTLGFIKRTMIFLKFALQTIGVALREDYDVVFATSTPLTVGIPGIFARWLRSKPFVFEVRDLWPELPKAMGVIRNPIILRLMSLLEWSIYHSANRLIGLASGIVDGIAKKGVIRDKIALIPNGCDFDVFKAPIERWRPNETKPGDLIAVYCGTHGIANGLSSVVDTAIELKRRGRNNIRIISIGNGKQKAMLQERTKKEGLDNLLFLEPVNKLKLAGLLLSADIGLQILANVPAFYYGTSPNKFFDYIALGLPVLNNYPGWLADIIMENKFGYVVPPDDPASFADALEQAANERESLKEKGKRALAIAKERFDRNDLANKFVDWVIGAVA